MTLHPVKDHRPAWPLDNRINVVLFAGMGGGCDGLEAAGFPVKLAINHDKVAVAVHGERHPHAEHLTCDVFEANPRVVTRGRPVGALHASPDCTHFSIAKGAKPVSPRRRSLAWVILWWAGTVRPEMITLENVWEITGWGPLIAKRDKATGRVLKLDGTIAAKGERVPVRQQQLVPDPKRKGETWRRFEFLLREMGYSFEYRSLICADYGIPTIRKRLFGVAKANGGKIYWPARTHAPRHKAKALGLLPWVGAHTIIDWSLPVRSIFGRPKDLAAATQARTARGVWRWVIHAQKPFIVPITHSGDARTHDIDEPLRTLTTAHRGELSVIVPKFTKDRPDGSKHALVAAFLAQHNNHGTGEGNIGRPANEPLSTITTSGAQQGVVAVSMSSFYSSNTTGGQGDPREPLRTITAGGNHASLVYAFLSSYYSLGGREHDPADPLGALTQKARHAVVTVNVAGETMVLSDIGQRMFSPDEGAAAHGFTGWRALPKWVTVDGKRRLLTKTEKYHLVGNSVPWRMVQLIAECNMRPAMFGRAAD